MGRMCGVDPSLIDEVLEKAEEKKLDIDSFPFYKETDQSVTNSKNAKEEKALEKDKRNITEKN